MGCEIVVKNLYKRYGEVEALRGISLTVPRAQQPPRPSNYHYSDQPPRG